MSPDREREYDELHAFVDFYATAIECKDPESHSHPTVVGAEILREYGKSQALAGLRQAVHDIVEETFDLPGSEVSRIDALLSAAGKLSISEARRRYAAAYKRLLRRGVIRNETEYHLAVGVLADVSSTTPDDEREQLETMVAAYGAK